jgi:hypothetical protein
MAITPKIIEFLSSTLECPKNNNKVKLSVCYNCLYCTRIDDGMMIRRVFCVYPGREEEKH